MTLPATGEGDQNNYRQAKPARMNERAMVVDGKKTRVGQVRIKFVTRCDTVNSETRSGSISKKKGAVVSFPPIRSLAQLENGARYYC